MRAAVLALVAAALAALALAIRADVRAWREGDEEPEEIVGMPTWSGPMVHDPDMSALWPEERTAWGRGWPYRGEVN